LQAVEELGKVLVRRGIRLMLHEGEASLVTAPEYSSIIENILKEERERELGRAGIETLAIIAYKGPLSRKEVEYVRGVNSQFAIRTLLLRGLIEKKQSDENGRAMVYTITSDTLRHLGLQHISELPEYESSRTQLEVTEEPEEQLEETEGETSEYSS
jgi:segregation and condensation protein B